MGARSGLLLRGLGLALGASLCAATAPLASGADEAVLEVVTEDLDYPANIAVPDDGSGRVFVVEHYLGTIRVLQDGKLLPGSFLDIGDRVKAEGEEGLVGLAFPPDFAHNPEVYVAYTPDGSTLLVSRFRVDEGAKEALASSEDVVLSTERWSRYHHCGHIEFGPVDRMLYVCIGVRIQATIPDHFEA